MITNKILLIEIALVVITTVRHTYADNRIQMCEELIKEVGIFETGPGKGLSNFREAFKRKRFEDIQNAINKIPDNFGNALRRKIQKQLTIDYSLCLLNTINEMNKVLDFKSPETWCRENVQEYRIRKIIKLDFPLEDQVKVCKRSIVELCTDQDVPSGNFAVLKLLYENYSYKFLEQKIVNNPTFNNLHYTLGYFNHLVDYVDKPTHMQYDFQFKTIIQFCIHNGFKLLPSED